LKHVFGVGGAARNPLRGPKDSAVVFLEKSFQFAGGLVFHESQGFKCCLQECSPSSTQW
jgi:hypothetical protein